MKRSVIFLFCVAFLDPSAVYAQDFNWNAKPEQEQGQQQQPKQEKTWEKKGVPGSPEFVKAIAEEARKLLPRAVYGDGKVVGAETAEEKKKVMLVPQEALDRAVKSGALVGYAMHCNLDWKKGAYVPLLEQELNSGLWQKKQMRYIQLVMDLTRVTYAKNLPGACTEDMKKFISSKMVQ